MDLSHLLSERFDDGSKGVPEALAGLRLDDVGNQRLNILRDPFPRPVAIIRQSALDTNIRLMAEYTRSAGVELAPHGKTSMSPQLFDAQLRAGAWGITCATSAHLRIYRRYGVPRIIMANQLLDESAIRFVARELDRDSDFEFYGIVDSVEGVRRYGAGLADMPGARRLNLLVEMGAPGGRTGARTIDQILQVAREIKDGGDRLALAGIEAFEGIFPGEPVHVEQRVADLMTHFSQVARACDENRLFDADTVILSAGGSAFFDQVVTELNAVRLSRPTRVILRSGCYVTHDHGFYAGAIDRLRKRTPDPVLGDKGFEPALEIWALVQSTPEPGLALLTLGKRDASFDLGLPMPIKYWRPGTDGPTIDIRGKGQVAGLNDHHAYLRSGDLDLAVGDLVGFGISHPCTTFDRWQYLYLVNDDYDVLSAIRTFF